MRNCEPGLGLYEQLSPLPSLSALPSPVPVPVPLVPGNARQFYVNSLQLNIPSFPSPSIGLFFICLLQYCSAQTTTCFGSGNTLKCNIYSSISPPAGDLVLVSKMAQGWTCQGKLFRKPGNVYFHCHSHCVQRKQPFL